MKLYAVILCGGRGERFWPRSRRNTPKQFAALLGRHSLLQQTSERVRGVCPVSRQVFVAPAELEKQVRTQVKPAKGRLLLEPQGKNTAPAIGLAAAWLQAESADATMLVLPSDHLVEDKAGFLASVRFAAELAQEHLLVTFGIPPSRPDTGYGYIQMGDRIRSGEGQTAHKVRGFREKPDPQTAAGYVSSGSFLWNSGMFVWRVDAIMDAFRRFLPELASELVKFSKAVGTKGESSALARVYRCAESISIDYAVMEKADNLAVVRAGFDWDDLGSWPALSRHLKPDAAGNTAQGLSFPYNSHDCVVSSDAGLVALLGVRDLVVVRAGDAVLVAHKDELGSLKLALKEMAEKKETAKYL